LVTLTLRVRELSSSAALTPTVTTGASGGAWAGPVPPFWTCAINSASLDAVVPSSAEIAMKLKARVPFEPGGVFK